MPKINLDTFWPYKIAVLADLIGRQTMKVVRIHGDLNLSQWRVLAALGDHDGRSSAEVVAMTPMDKGIVSRAVTSLVDRNFLTRVEDGADKRKRKLFLTQTGKDHYGAISKDLQTILFTHNVSAPDDSNFINTLNAHILTLIKRTTKPTKQ